MTITQKEAVISAVTNILGDDFVEGETVVKDVLTKDQLIQVRNFVFEGIISGDVNYGKSTDDEKEVSIYVNSMINNYFRRDTALNGGVPYTPSKEGSPRDSQLKALNQLLNSGKVVEGDANFIKITNQIEVRKQQLAAERAAKKASASIGTIDTSVLPADLQELANGLIGHSDGEV